MKPNRLSQTAAYLAIKFYGLTQNKTYRSLFDEKIVQFYHDLVRELPFPHSFFYSALQKDWSRNLLISVNDSLLPGDLMHVLLRKYCVGRLVDELIENGYEQLVVLGAGFDHLAVHHSGRGIKSVELDAPRMADLKTSFVQKNGYNSSSLTIIPAFFTRDSLAFILDVLTDIEASRKTIVVAEGFFDYFTPEQTEELLLELSQFFSGRIALVSTVFSLEELPWFRAFVYRNCIRMAGERLRLHHSLAEFTSLLMNQKFAVDHHLTGSLMHSTYLTPLNISQPVLSGFHLIKAVHK